ncbi:E3 ubiquitin-protein ligase RLIM [Manis javanica]|nr:E3 ubiquitin-protein ligase RLIM [Manis javanica]
MENSSPNNEEDSVDQQKTQMGPLVREEDFYGFVSNLSAEDYRLLRDNNLLGTPGESTEEEVPERPQFMKESPPQHSGENKDTESSNVERSDDSVIECLLSPERTENVGSGPRGNQPWGVVSHIIPTRNHLVPDLQITVTNHINDGRPNGENEYRLLLTRFPQEILENSPWQVESPPPESSFATPLRSEGRTNEGLMQVPPTRGQQRRRIRSRSPDHRRTRARTESMSTPHSVRELYGRHHYSVLSQTSEQPLVNESESHQAEEAPRQQTPDFAFLNWGLLDSRAFRAPLTSERANVPLENDGGRLRHMFSHCEQEDARAHVSIIRSPGHRIVSPYLNRTASCANQSRAMTGVSHSRNLTDSASVSEPSVFRSLRVMERPVSPYASESSYDSSSEPEPNIFRSIRVMERPVSPYASENSYDSSSTTFNSYLRLDFSSTSTVLSSSSSYMSTRDGSPVSSYTSSDASSVMFDNYDESRFSPGTPTSYWSPVSSYTSSDASSVMFDNYDESRFSPGTPTSYWSPVSSYTSSDASSVMFDNNDESRFSPGTPTEPFEQSRQMSPVVFEDSDSWPSIDLEQFILFDDEESRGLTKAQIDSLPVRSFRKDDTETSCCICITDYKEGTKVRILPCSHSFHSYCIDHWLAEKRTCPLCRSELADAEQYQDSPSLLQPKSRKLLATARDNPAELHQLLSGTYPARSALELLSLLWAKDKIFQQCDLNLFLMLLLYLQDIVEDYGSIHVFTQLYTKTSRISWVQVTERNSSQIETQRPSLPARQKSPGCAGPGRQAGWPVLGSRRGGSEAAPLTAAEAPCRVHSCAREVAGESAKLRPASRLWSGRPRVSTPLLISWAHGGHRATLGSVLGPGQAGSPCYTIDY